MSLCDIDYDRYVDVEEGLRSSVGTETCVECRQLIPQGTPHYKVLLWRENEETGPDTHLGQHTCCEECGDLALSVLERGCCWSFGDLRDDLRERNGY